MSSTLISLCLTALVVLVTAEQLEKNGYGGEQVSYATPSNQRIRYAGPIVYTNEKPPVIHFPPPPAPGKGGYGGGGGGNFGKGHSVKYVPLPHHDLPVLIYQSDISPPIHVVGQTKQVTATKSEYGPLKSDYTSSTPQYTGSSQQISYGGASSQKLKPYDPISADYSSQSSKTVYRPPQRAPKQQYSTHPSKPYTSSESFEYTSPTKNQYRVFKPFTDLFGSASAPATQTEYIISKPKNTEHSKKPSPMPHIIYAGHPPIHVFQQPPIYMAAPKGNKNSYTSTKSVYGRQKSEYLYTSESAPVRTVTMYSSTKPTYGPPKPKNEYHTSPKSEYRDCPPAKSAKTEYGRQKAEYSSPSAVYLKPQQFEFSSSSESYMPLKIESAYRSQKNESPYRSQKSESPYRSQKNESPYRSQKNESPYHSQKSEFSYRPSKLWGQSSNNYGLPIKYKTSKQVTYSPAPKTWNKPPIIIYQGVKPPVHMFENVVHFASVNTGGGGIPPNYATRRVSSTGGGMEPRANIEYTNTGSRYLNQNPTMWIPAYGVQTQHGYQTTLYVSDLTSAGSSQQMLTSAPTSNGASSAAGPTVTQTAQVTNLDVTQTTTQVTTIRPTPADEVKNMMVTESPYYTSNTSHQTLSPGVSFDSIQTAFLASGLNHQNTALNSIPVSHSSAIVQAPGGQPHPVI